MEKNVQNTFRNINRKCLFFKWKVNLVVDFFQDLILLWQVNKTAFRICTEILKLLLKSSHKLYSDPKEENQKILAGTVQPRISKFLRT